MPNAIKNILNFVGIIIIQVLVIDQIYFGLINHMINPILLPVVIIILPIGWSKINLILSSFVLGILLDAFHNTLGINASAMITIAFIRPYIMRLISPREGFEMFFEPNIINLQLGQYLIYSSIIFFSYHMIYFLLESLSYQNLGIVILKTLLSTIAAIIISAIYQYLTIKKE